MKKLLLLIFSIAVPFVFCIGQHPDALQLPAAKFSTGDNAGWSKPGFEDSGWKDIRTGEVWQAQGFPDYHGYAWYRIRVVIPSSLKTNGYWRDSLRIFLAHINDVDETWLNGIKIGKTGSFPDDTEGYISKWPAIREYHISATNPAIKWDEENVIAIRDYDGGGTGGIFMGNPYLDMLERTDGVTVTIFNENMKYLPDTTLASYSKPYRIMQKAIKAQKRDIVYSLCQYGMKDVWKWGRTVDGQSWRTTEDIEDTWESFCRIGFQQASLYPYAKPGNWNDPDMMIVGQVGWGESLHSSRLTPDEQYTHVSLWSLLAAPLLIGCDISRLDAFTLNLLTNDEVLAIDQDALGKQAQQMIRNEKYQVWVKELEDGSKAVGIFNLDTAYRKIVLDFKGLHLPGRLFVRDVWRQKDLGEFNLGYNMEIPPHGVKLLSVKGSKIVRN